MHTLKLKRNRSESLLRKTFSIYDTMHVTSRHVTSRHVTHASYDFEVLFLLHCLCTVYCFQRNKKYGELEMLFFMLQTCIVAVSFTTY